MFAILLELEFVSSPTGEFYGINPMEANLELIARFFEKYPSYEDKAFLSVKVCFSELSNLVHSH